MPCSGQIRAIVIGFLALSLGAPGCAVNPVTGEREISFMSLEEELELGKEVSKRLEERVGLWEDPELVAYVQGIGAQLARNSPRQEVEYTFNILDDEFPNALALPGGYVYVSRGLLTLVGSEDQLVNVLGHEIGHVAARHASADSWRSTAIGLLSGIGALALGPLSAQAGQGFLAAHSRSQETQADEIGQELALKAGWRPLGMSEFLRSLDRDDTIREQVVREAGFLDSHPVTSERIELTRARAQQLGDPDRPAEALAREPFLEKLRGLVVGQDPRAGVFLDERVFVHADLDFRIRFPEGWQTLNAQSFVGASDGPVNIRLELQGTESDPKKAARQWLAEQRKRRDEAAEKGESPPEELTRTKAGRRRVARDRIGYAIEGTAQRGQVSVLIFWVPLEDRMYRLTCSMLTQLRPSYLNDCRATVASLRTTRAKERERIQEVTLELDRALANETLRQFGERTGNHWSVELTAAANGLSLPYELREGQLIKYARAKVYEPEPEAAPEPTDDPKAAPDPE